MAREAMCLLGWVRWGERCTAREMRFWGLTVWALTLPPGDTLRGRLAARWAERYLLRRGVRECLLPEGFPFAERWARRGLAALDRRPLLRERAAQWTLAERQALGLTGDIAIAAPQVKAEVERAAETILRHCDRVTLPRVPGAEALRDRLRWESGAALRLVGGERLGEAETLLCFGPADIRGRRLTISPNGPGPGPRLVLPPSLRGIPAEGTEEEHCLLLWRGGVLRAAEIGVKSRN